MSFQDYTLPEFAERYEYIVFQPNTPIQAGAQGSPQPNRNDITFTINDRTSIYDYANGYFDITFYIERLVAETGSFSYATYTAPGLIWIRFDISEFWFNRFVLGFWKMKI